MTAIADIDAVDRENACADYGDAVAAAEAQLRDYRLARIRRLVCVLLHDHDPFAVRADGP